MKTAHDTFTVWDDGTMAAGFDSAVGGQRPTAIVRQAGQGTHIREENKIIDLSAWRAANLGLFDEELQNGMDWSRERHMETEEFEPVTPAPRPSKSRRIMITAEVVSTMSVVVAALALIVRVLTF